jgi:hypothetical protein
MDTSPASRTTASGSPPTGKRVVVTAFGSLGDLHPYLAIALGLKSRGHEAVLVTSACYRRKVEALGLGFRAMRPDSRLVSWLWTGRIKVRLNLCPSVPGKSAPC